MRLPKIKLTTFFFCVGIVLCLWKLSSDEFSKQQNNTNEEEVNNSKQQENNTTEDRRQQKESIYNGLRIAGVVDIVPKWTGQITAFYIDQDSIVCDIEWHTDCVAVQLIFVQNQIFIEVRKCVWQPRDRICEPSCKTTWDLDQCLRQMVVSFGTYHSVSNNSITKHLVRFLSI